MQHIGTIAAVVLGLALALSAWRCHRQAEALADLRAAQKPPKPAPDPRPVARAIAAVLEARTISRAYDHGDERPTNVNTDELDHLAEHHDISGEEIAAAGESASTALLCRLIERIAAERGETPGDVTRALVLHAETDLLAYTPLDTGHASD